jgi:hypothetical protein
LYKSFHLNKLIMIINNPSLISPEKEPRFSVHSNKVTHHSSKGYYHKCIKYLNKIFNKLDLNEQKLEDFSYNYKYNTFVTWIKRKKEVVKMFLKQSRRENTNKLKKMSWIINAEILSKVHFKVFNHFYDNFDNFFLTSETELKHINDDSLYEVLSQKNKHIVKILMEGFESNSLIKYLQTPLISHLQRIFNEYNINIS